jgi:hypothetical protein
MIAALGVLALLGATAPDFVRDVQPILAASCQILVDSALLGVGSWGSGHEL